MSRIPEREQTCTMFDTLYTLARKMEVHQSNCNSRGVPSDGYRDRYQWYPTPANRVATVGEGGDFLPPDPEKHKSEPLGDDPLDGLSTQMTQAMNHFQREECCCFICRQTGHFMRECPHKDAYCAWQKLPRGRSASRRSHPEEPITPSHEEESITVNARVVVARNSTSLFVDGPTTNWLGPETVVKLVVEGCEVNALADIGSQVNTVIPKFVTQNGWPVLPLEDLVDHLLHLVGLGGNQTWPLGFVTLDIQVKEITGYDEDIIFLIVPDGSEFSKRVPLVIGTCTLGHMVNMIKESELDMLSPPWVVVRASRLLSTRRGTVTSNDKSIGDVANPSHMLQLRNLRWMSQCMLRKASVWKPSRHKFWNVR